MYGQLVILCVLGELAMSIARISDILVTKTCKSTINHLFTSSESTSTAMMIT